MKELKNKIEDLKAEIAALEVEPTNDYYPQWEKNRDLDDRRSELARLISQLI